MSDDLSAPAKNVADKLSLFMSPEGKHAFPAVWKLRRLTDLGDSTVRKALKELREKQWVKAAGRSKGGRQVSTTYDAILPPHVVDNGLNPLHDEGYWEKQYEELQQREINRKKNALRKKGRHSANGHGALSESPQLAPINPLHESEYPLSQSEYPLHGGDRRFPEGSTNYPDVRFSEKANDNENLFEEVLTELASRRLNRKLRSGKLAYPDRPASRQRWTAVTRENIEYQEGADIRALMSANPSNCDIGSLCDLYEGPDGAGNEYGIAMLTRLAVEESCSDEPNYPDAFDVIAKMLLGHSSHEVKDAILFGVDDWTPSGFESAIAQMKYMEAL